MKKSVISVIAIMVAASLFATDEVYNLRDYIISEGYSIATFIDGGEADVEYHKDYGPLNAFDGFCEIEGEASEEAVSEAIKIRWLGETDDGTYLKFMLPHGWTCDIDSFKMWNVVGKADWEISNRAPTGWQFFGITEDGVEISLSDVVYDGTLRNVANKSLLVNITPMPENAGKRFIGFKWIPRPTDTTFDWDVGLMELEIFVKNIVKPVNLRDYITGQGYNITNFVYGGVSSSLASEYNVDRQYADDYGPVNAFDGICITNKSSLRWLGEIRYKTFLELRLPAGYSCDIHSYRMWRLSIGAGDKTDNWNVTERSPKAWMFYGLTKDGEELLLSEVADTNAVHQVENFAVNVELPPEMSGKEFVGFKWIPTNSVAYLDRQNYEYAVGLMEFEIFANKVSSPKERDVHNLREYEFGAGESAVFSGVKSASELGYGFEHAFDGIRMNADITLRYLGSISGDTYLEARLPAGWTCGIDSYTMWRLCSSDKLYIQRAPTAWEFYGLERGGSEVLLSKESGTNVLQNTDSFTVDVPQSQEIQNKRFIGFRWVPKDSLRVKQDTWEVGLMEFEILVKDIQETPKGTVIIVR